ncbi:MAG: hypothetical protein GXO76_13695 [Calditrichaeota bacterium]|nr:hypothetical protein [Calditrichota bacterium]
MTCKEVQNKFTAYLENALPPEEIQDVESHLESCARCRAAFQAYGETVRALKKLRPTEPPALQKEFLFQKIRREVNRGNSSGRIYRKRRKLAWVIMTGVVVLFMIWNYRIKENKRFPAASSAQQKQENEFFLEEYVLSTQFSPVGQQASLAVVALDEP